MSEPAGYAGEAVVQTSWWGTGIFTATAVAAAAVPSAFGAIALGVAGTLFAAGIVAFLWSYARIVSRSRTEVIGVGPVYFLTGDTAPSPVRRSLLGSLVVEVVVALVTAFVRPYTSLAAGTLVPVYGLALCGVWAALYGRFPTRKGSGREA